MLERLAVPLLPLALLAATRAGAAAPQAPSPDAGWTRLLYARHEPGEPPPGPLVRDRAPSASFALPAGASLAPWVPAGGLRAVHLGSLSVEHPGRHRLGLEVEGAEHAQLWAEVAPGRFETVTLDADGRAFTPWLALDEPVPVCVSWSRDGQRPARLVTLWEREHEEDLGFRAEPVPRRIVRPLEPGAWSGPGVRPDASAPAPAATLDATGLRAARVRFGQLGCAHCHAADATLPAPTRRGPDLTGVADRVSVEWLRRFVRDPQDVKPGGGMPDVFGHEDADFQDAEALVHYLVGPDAPAPSAAPATEPAVLAEGRRLYHTVGCVACHGPRASPREALGAERSGAGEAHGDDHLPADVPRVRAPHLLAGLARKWKPAALAAFLADPHATRPDSRMPGLGLSAAEADLLATYLAAQFGAAPAEDDFDRDDDLARRGAEVFAERGCHACHERPRETGAGRAAPFATPVAAWRDGAGCLSPEALRTPRYRFRPGDTELVLDFVRRRAALPEVAPAPLEAARDRLDDLSCGACHERDGTGGVDPALSPYFVGLDEASELGDEGRLPPTLTGVGAKLRTGWLERVLREGAGARPYYGARMPRFARADADVLLSGLPGLDGAHPGTDAAWPAVTDELVLAGKELMGLRGMACIACHTVGDRPPAGTAGPDMTAFAERLRYAWFRDYMHAPDRFKPGTRMPRFTTDGASAFPQLGGDAGRQVDAMWAYFTLGEHMPVPEGVPGEEGLALVPTDRPLVFRTFLDSVGARAICVGDPTGLHYAFDAGAVRLAEVWRGAFVDASANWTARGGGQAGGRGPVVWRAPDGAPMVLARDRVPAAWPDATGTAAGLRFRGYRLDARGAPTFRYELADPAAPDGEPLRIEETFFPYPREGALFARLIAVENVPAGAVLWIRADDAATPDRAVDLVPVANLTLRRIGLPEAEGWWGLVPTVPGEPVIVSVETLE